MKLTELKASGKVLREAPDAMAASSNASGRAWGVSHIALPGWSTSPPHGPTDPWTRANTAPPRCRLPGRGPRPGKTAHARRAPSAVRTRPLPRCWARLRACERWRGERHRQTPGDHATNLGATMLVLLRMAPLAYFRGRLGTL
jgi:hypothetical protein